jgi:glycosyltransferase involved in cell wall biosynthesis
MPVFSVVTPIFNAVRFLPATLDSVARLSVEHEHIVVDGGSADGTVELLESRSDPGLLWISEADRGQTHAVNKGFKRAGGQLIGWLNGDDEYSPRQLTAQWRTCSPIPTSAPCSAR